ncbi:hypothetical protein D3C72_2337820 [compost metagenome]
MLQQGFEVFKPCPGAVYKPLEYGIIFEGDYSTGQRNEFEDDQKDHSRDRHDIQRPVHLQLMRCNKFQSVPPIIQSLNSFTM